MRRILSFAMQAVLLASVCVLTAKAQDNWKPTGGPLGGAVGDISADSSGRVWISVLRDGVWYTDDHAKTWTPFAKGLPEPNVKYICASNDGNVYCVGNHQDKLYRLDTKRAAPQWTWEDITPPVQLTISDIITTVEGYIVLGSAPCALRSTNNGATWDLNFGDSVAVGNADHVANGKKGEYATYHRVGGGIAPRSIWYKSEEANPWKMLSKPVPSGQLLTSMQIVRGTPDVTIVVGLQQNRDASQEIAGRIYTYDVLADTGWTLTYQQPYKVGGGKNANNIDDIGKIKMKGSSGNDILYANAHGPMLRSMDMGYTWEMMFNEKMGDEPFQITAEKNDGGVTHLYQESEPDGIHVSIDSGRTWAEKQNVGLLMHFMFGAAIDTVSAAAKSNTAGGNAFLYGVIEFGLVNSSDAGKTWGGPVEFEHESYTNALWVESTKGNVVAGTDIGIFLSENHGQDVTHVKPSLGIRQFGEVKDVTFVGPNRLFAAMADSFYYSTDAGMTWQLVETTGLPTSPTVLLHSVACGVSDTVIAGGDNSNYYRSINAGRTWNDIGHAGNPGKPYRLLVHTDGSYLSLHQGPDGGVWRSSNAGVSWLQIFPFEGMTPRSRDYYAMNNFKDGSIIVCSDSGMYQSDPTDPTYQKWTNVGSGLYFHGDIDNTKQVNGSEVIRNNNSGIYYAAMRGTSFWESSHNFSVRLPWTSASKNSTVTSYPNPFVSGTTLGFELTEGSQVHIEIIDVMGRVAATIPTAYFGVGKHSIGFEAGDLAAGQYMIILRAGDKIETGWITLTK